MSVISPISSHQRPWLRRLILAAILVLLGILCLFLALMSGIRWPTSGHWAKDTTVSGELRDGGFTRLFAQTSVRDPNDVVLKIYLGWSQEVWIAVLDRPGAEPQIQLLEHEFRTRKQAIRTIVLSRSEVDGFLANFDRAALGIRVAEFGYDGREIAFERRLPDRTISYEGNASFSRQDASMAGIVDQLIATHGGYKFLQPSKFGRNF